MNQADRLFARLDNRLIDDASGGWIAYVLGVHIADGDIWVQIAAADEPDRNLLLHLLSPADVDHAIAALDAWSKTPGPGRAGIIDVRPGDSGREPDVWMDLPESA